MSTVTTKRLMGWARTAPTVATVLSTPDPGDIVDAVAKAGSRGVIARGLGRSYGDNAQNGGGLVIDMSALNKIHSMDRDTHVVDVDAGVNLDQLMRAALPLGLWVPVLPGTRQVTVGGAIACDIHGKNHHSAGSFGNHVLSMELLTASGEVRTLTPDGRGVRTLLGDRRRQRADGHHPSRHDRDDPDGDGVLHRRRRRHRRPRRDHRIPQRRNRIELHVLVRLVRRDERATEARARGHLPRLVGHRSTSSRQACQGPAEIRCATILHGARHLPQRPGQQVHLRPDDRTLVPDGQDVPRQGPEPDAVLSPARHGRRVEPGVRVGRIRAVPVRGTRRSGGRVQEDPGRHSGQRPRVVPQRVQALRPRKPSAAELSRSPAGMYASTSRSGPGSTNC